MALTYGTGGSNLNITVATAFSRSTSQGANGNVTKTYKKYARGETSTERYDTALPALASGTLDNGDIISYQYTESNTDEPKVTETTVAFGTIP